MSITVSGGHQVRERLGELGRATTEAMETALKAGAVPIVNSWKQKAPVKTGSYRRSIHLLEQVDKREGAVTVFVGTDIVDPPYPVFLEFGTARMAPRPSARPAWDDSKGKAMAEVAKVLELVARRAAR